MHTASLELCKELYKLSGWLDTYAEWLSSCEFEDEDTYSLVPNATEKSVKNGEGYPAYDLGYLLRKLKEYEVVVSSADDRWQAWHYKGYGRSVQFADTPEDAACMLAIELFKQGILKRQ